jgi:transcriptional regulator with PAS, ATPase and Fis domain
MSTGKGEPTQSVRLNEQPKLDSARLILNPDTPQAREIALGPQTVIGKDPDCDVVLDDPTVSRMHARLRMTPQGVQIEDMDSRNGTLVNGTPVKLAQLTPGSTITLGRALIRFEVGAPEAPPPQTFGDAVGSSPAMQQVFALLKRIAPSELTVTLLGETGVGKDVLARAIHANSPRKAGPFEVFDCGAVAANLIESSLFGHMKGSFTGAVSDRQGAFELARKGTIFLDEVGELPLELQPRLLRVLEDQTVRRVGGTEHLPVDIRVIAATNRDLAAEVEAGRFRQDLFFRLNAAVVHIPPLRDRLDDLPRLVEAMLAETGRLLSLSEATLAALKSYDWPGNVRELKNVIASAAAFADGPTLEPRHLMFYRGTRERMPTLDRLPLAGKTLEKLERAAIKQTLDQTGGNKSKAARVLGIASSTLYEKIKKYNL